MKNNLARSNRREKKRRKAQYGMRVSGRSVFVAAGIIARKAENAKKNGGG